MNPMIQRIILCALSLLFSLYVGFNAYTIASAGVTNQIPQLEGDGGGGLMVAALCLLGGAAVFIRAWLAYTLFILALVIAVLAGVAFQDPVTGLWALGPFVLAALYAAEQWWRRRSNKRRNAYPHLPHRSV